MNDVVIVVPTVRENNIRDFLRVWDFQTPVYVIEDNATKTFQLPFRYVNHYSWQDIDSDLGDNSWIIPRKTDCIRSYGYWRAWKDGAKYIITLDDDCYPLQTAQSFISMHIEALQSKWEIPRWHSTLVDSFPRGYPYERHTENVSVGISHGVWHHTTDYDAMQQLVYTRDKRNNPYFYNGVIPRYRYFPMCGMNLAWRAEYTPFMYFLLMGKDTYPYDRFGDIWSGIIVKKIFDALGIYVYSGEPSIRHMRASNVWKNREKEFNGIEENEHFWSIIDSMSLDTSKPFVEIYEQVAKQLEASYKQAYYNTRKQQYWGEYYWTVQLPEAMTTWASLFKE